jgi:hypothetical protein
MLKTLVLTAALAGLAPTANAGGIDLRFLFDSHGKIRVGVGLPHHRVRNAHSQHRTVRPSRHQHHDHARRVWVSARSERVSHRVWIPERHASYVVPARYEYRRDECGHRVRVMVRRSYTKTRCIPGRYETRYRTVRHAGHYETRGGSRSRESNSRDSRSRRGRRSRTH